ncbi:RAD-like 1 [Prunus dulcis]|uniref:RAD-like 1 n=1 Tax=Prunus dulcis TaxID=3755 RepID=A0A4Y1RZW4_PRUDU|nr:RAD-like 1 [Prunus dulcis]
MGLPRLGLVGTLILLHIIPFSMASSRMSSTAFGSSWTTKQNKDFENAPATTKQNKDFEKAVAVFDKDTVNRWDKVVKSVGRKTLEEVKKYYNLLVVDIMSLKQIVLSSEIKILKTHWLYFTRALPTARIMLSRRLAEKSKGNFENALPICYKDTTNCSDNVAKSVGEKMQRKSRSIMSFLLKISCLLRLDKWPSQIKKKFKYHAYCAWTTECPQLPLAPLRLPSKTKILKTLWLGLTKTLPTAGIMLSMQLAKKFKGSGWQKNVDEVKMHYELLVEDIMLIALGQALFVFDKDTANRWDNVVNAVGEKIQRKSRSIISFMLKISCLLSLDNQAKKNKDFENALVIFYKDTTNCWDNVDKAVAKKMQRKSRCIMYFLLKISCLLRLDKCPSRITEKLKTIILLHIIPFSIASRRMSSTTSSSSWTSKQNKDFENALAVFDKDTANRWDNVVNVEVKKHYELLVEDIMLIELRSKTKILKMLAVFDKDNANRWDNVAKAVGRKTLKEVKKHYEFLVEDIILIES